MNNQLPLLVCTHLFPCPPDGIGIEEVEVKCKYCGETKTFKTLRGRELELERKHRWKFKEMYADRTER